MGRIPSCLWSLRIFPSLPAWFTPYEFLSRCKFRTLTARQLMVEFYLLTFSRFPLRKKNTNSGGKNQTHDFRTIRCAGYLLDHLGNENNWRYESKMHSSEVLLTALSQGPVVIRTIVFSRDPKLHLYRIPSTRIIMKYAHIFRWCIFINSSLAIPYPTPIKTLPVVERLCREDVRHCGSEEVRHLIIGLRAVQISSEPEVNRTVGRVHALPGPAIKVIVVFYEIVVKVACGPCARLIHAATAHLTSSTCYIPGVWTGHGGKAMNNKDVL